MQKPKWREKEGWLLRPTKCRKRLCYAWRDEVDESVQSRKRLTAAGRGASMGSKEIANRLDKVMAAEDEKSKPCLSLSRHNSKSLDRESEGEGGR